MALASRWNFIIRAKNNADLKNNTYTINRCEKTSPKQRSHVIRSVDFINNDGYVEDDITKIEEKCPLHKKQLNK